MNDFLRYLSNIFNTQPAYKERDVGQFFAFAYEPRFSLGGRRVYVGGLSQFPNGKQQFLDSVNAHLELPPFSRWVNGTEKIDNVNQLTLEILVEGVSNADYFGVVELLDSLEWWVYESALDRFVLKSLSIKN